MRRARHSARSILSVAFVISLCATAALALPPKAEAVIRLGDPNTVSLSNGLVGYWPLDGQTTDWATGQTKDLSGNGNTGSLALMSTSSSPTPGKIGQALNFNGSSNVVTTAISFNDPQHTPFQYGSKRPWPPGTSS